MSDLILFSQQDPSIPRVSVKLELDLTVEQKEEANKAEQGTGAAPEVTWADKKLMLSILGENIEVASTDVDVPPRVCVAGKSPVAANVDVVLEIVSGGVQIVTTNLVQDVLTKIWPAEAESKFGKLERLVVTSVGLQIETQKQDASQHRRRFHLTESASVQSDGGMESHLVWRQLAWRDAGLVADEMHKDPADRLKDVRNESDIRLTRQSGTSPVTSVGRFDERSEAEGAVFVQVRIKNDNGTFVPEATERIVPGWALSIGGADWSPRSLVIKGDPALDKADFIYTDTKNAFDDEPADTETTKTSFKWSWTDTAPIAKESVLPELLKLAADPPLVSTGEVPGAGANLPYLWQRAKLIVGKDAAQQIEPGVWLRYRLDPLAVRNTAVSRQADYDAGLSHSIRLSLKDANDVVEQWQIDLSLLPKPGTSDMIARLWLQLQAVDTNKRGVTLTMLNARIEAAAPPIHALQTALNDAAALPNQADRSAGLYPNTRIRLANDRELPDEKGTQTHVLQADQNSTPTPSDPGIRLSVRGGSRDVVVAYVPGPVAAVDLIPRTGGNLTPAASVDPTDPPPPDRVRNYESGLAAVHLMSKIALQTPADKSPLGTVSVSATSDLFLPAEEMVAALLPWSLVSVQQGDFVGHQLQPLHHNALLEAFDWARSTADRQDPEPGALPPLIDPDGAEGGTRDFRQDELQLAMRCAVRDRFSDATVNPFPLDVETEQAVANWLPQVTFKANDTEITPEIKRNPKAPNTLDFVWSNAPDSPQRLKLTQSPRAFTVSANSTTCTSEDHGLANGTAIQLFRTGTFPGGVTPNKTYYAVISDADSFELSTTDDGNNKVLITTASEGEWQPIADDWLSAWFRWTTDDDVSRQPTVHVEPDGRNGARQAKNSDVPLLEQRTPVTAVAAGWLAGRMWVVFGVDAPQGKTKLFAWEPLSANSEPLPLPVAIEHDKRVDHLAVDAGDDSLTLCVAQGTSCKVFTFVRGTDPIGELEPPIPIPQTSSPILSIRVIAQRLFVATEKNLSVFRYDGQVVNVASVALDKFTAMDVRASAQEKSVYAAVAQDKSGVHSVQLHGWTSFGSQGVIGQPTAGPTLVVAGNDVKEISSVMLQPIGDRLHSYAVVFGEASQSVVTWRSVKLTDQGQVAPISESSLVRDLEILNSALVAPLRIQSDPALNDDDDLDGGAPLSRWIALTTAPTDDGRVNLTSIPILKWNTDGQRPHLGSPSAFSGHSGQVVDMVMVPGRHRDAMASAPEARFGAWLVTGGADGTVRVWDPESGQEKFRHTMTSGKWLDSLGVNRQRSNAASDTGFWAEAISVPKQDESGREMVLMLSTLGAPVDLLQNSVSRPPETELRFLCQDLPLISDTDLTVPNSWIPAPFDMKNRRIRHGIYGCCGIESKVPRLFGLPVEVVQLKKIVFDRTFKTVTAGQAVAWKSIELDVVLSNPAEMAPDGSKVAIVDKNKQGEITSALVHLSIDGNGKIEIKDGSTFDWRFPLTDQLPPGTQSVLPGRLARLAGKVSGEGGVLKLTPELNASRAEALGRLRRLSRVPELVIDPSPNQMVRFREIASEKNKLDVLGNPLPHPAADETTPMTATEIGMDAAGQSVVLHGAQPTDAETKSGSLQLADLNTGQRLVTYTDRLKRARLVVDPAIGADANKQRLTAIGVAEDGTVRVRQLFEIEKDSSSPTNTPTPITVSMQEQSRFVLPSPAEDVQVFDDARGMRWLLTRCRDGSAWLTSTLDGAIQHNLSLPETAVTAIAFGPSIPIPSAEEITGKLYANWENFFGSIDPQLFTPGAEGSLRAILSIGGADGRTSVYAVAEKEPPKLLRSFARLVDPVCSLSLAFEPPRQAEGSVPGIFLMSCDARSPIHLAEILSGDSPELQVENLHTKPALQGVLLYNTNLRGVVQTIDGVTKAVSAWTKAAPDQFTATVIDSPVSGTQIVHSASSAADGFAVISGSQWHLYDFDTIDAKFKPVRSNVPGTVRDIADTLIHGTDRYLAALREDGVFDLWRKIPASTQWEQVSDTTNNTAARMDAATFGRVLLPMVVCRGMEGQVGSFHAVDLGASEWAWPEALGPVDANAPVAVAGLGGVPHLAVARSGNVTVWNLATGQLVHRVGLATPVDELALGEDLEHHWLLAGSKAPNSGKLVRLHRAGTDIQDVIVAATGTIQQHACLFAFAEGLRVIAVTGDGTSLTLQVIAPDTAGNQVTHNGQVPNFNATSFEILDVTSKNDIVSVLLRHSNDGTGAELSALSVPVTGSTTVVTHKLVDATPDAKAPGWGTFDLDEDENGLISVWTIAEDYSEVAKWSFNATTTTPPTKSIHIDKPGKPSIGEPKSLSVVRYDGRTRLVGVAADGMAIWDVDEKKLLRTDKLPGPTVRMAQVSVAAVVAADSKAGCVRFWDQQTGRLRQRLFTSDKRLGELHEPGQLVALSTPARPRLVVAGSDKTIVVDVAAGKSVAKIDVKLSSVTATVAEKQILLGGIDSADPKLKLWRVELGAEGSLTSTPTLAGPGTPSSIALLQHKLNNGEGYTLLAAASDTTLAIFKVPDNATSIFESALTTSNPITADGVIQAIRLSAAIEEDCILAAVSLKTTDAKGHVQLFDLPLKKQDGQERPFTSWSNKTLESKVSTGLAVALTMDGPRVVADTRALRVSALLRITAGMPPVFDLPIQLLNEKAFLAGRITPSRRLDLEISLTDKAKSLGLPESISKLTARAALIQGAYSCFLVDSIDSAKFRLAGVVVLWDDSHHSSDAMKGVLVLEDSRPTIPGDTANADFGAVATFDDSTSTSVSLRGPRSRMRVMPFDATSQAIDTLMCRETLSWYLAEKPDNTDINTELHLSDLLLDIAELNAASEQRAIVRAVFSRAGKPQIQGDLVVNVKRSPAGGAESYTFTLEKVAYAAMAAIPPALSEFGTTRDDVVYPAVPGGPVGQAFDLVEPQMDESVLDDTEKLHLVSLALDNSEIKLVGIKPPVSFPYDLNTGANVTQPLPLQPIDVPQLEHREAHGARIRARWPAAFEVVPAGDADGSPQLVQETLWLLAPLARTPRGVTALTLNLLVRPHGRVLQWTRLLTEGVLTIHRDGSNLFGVGADTADAPSVRNLLTSTILRSSGATQSELTSLFDDVRVQTHALRAGLSGVLVVRTRDARGRIDYRFVNSPYHSLVPLVAKRVDATTQGPQNNLEEDTDPRLLPSEVVHRMKTYGSPRFYPSYSAHDRSTLRGFERAMRVNGDPAPEDNTKLPAAVRLAESPTLRGAETPSRPLPAEKSLTAGTTRFLPQSFELGFGVDKPGAAFHQVVQCVGSMEGTADELHSSLPTTYLRRDPQRFDPPPRAGLQIDAQSSIKRNNDMLEAMISWTETLSIIPLEKDAFVTELKIVPDNATPPATYTVDEPSRCLRWFVRLGEQVNEVNNQLPLPLTPFADGRSVEAFDIFIVTRIKNLGEGEPLPDGSPTPPKVKPFLVAVHGDPSQVTARPADQIFKKLELKDEGYEIWQLRRKDDKPNGVPALFEWLKDLNKVTQLNLVWWKDGEQIDATSYPNVPQLTPIGLRDVQLFDPSAPRIAAVLNGSDQQGVLSKRREFTLFDGPAATANGISVTLQASNSETPWLRFSATDSERITISNPFSADEAQLHLVKVFDDGATLETHLKLTATS